MKPDQGQSAGFKLLTTQKSDPAFDWATFFAEKTGLISDAQERI